MPTWIKYPLTEKGLRSMKCGRFVALSRFHNADGFVIAYPVKNAIGFHCKSIHMEEIQAYGRGLLIERSTVIERREWYGDTGQKYPRKFKKHLVSTLSRIRQHQRIEQNAQRRSKSLTGD